ncbi:MAG: carboxymuconolactone decarboxylase family protein [Oscillospiraceae bacterium]|nr:carboxymuconolactone decarboxylase family protein [Oscillospiraceae bacterium]
MSMTPSAKEYRERLLPDVPPTHEATDPELVERFGSFAFDEVIAQSKLDDRTRMTVILAALVGCQGVEEFKIMLPAALNVGVTPLEAREIVYQAVPYLGMGRVFPFVGAMNEIFTARGVELPLPNMAMATPDSRERKGEAAQVSIFGDSMYGFAQSGPEETRHINRWLTANCCGDWSVRGGCGYEKREVRTRCYLAAQGGCESQLTSHAKANLRLGNDKAFLIDVISNLVPYIGYPRCLNALRCLEEAAK